MKYTGQLRTILSHKIAASGIATSLLLSNALTFGALITNPASASTVQSISHQKLFAASSINLKLDGINFPVELDLRNARIRGNIPRQLFEKDLIAGINKLDGLKIKNTRYNKYTLRNIDLKSIDNGGVTLGFTVNLKKYECVKFFGKYRCTKLASITLNGTMKAGIAVRNNQAIVTYRGHTIKGNKWYRNIVYHLDNAFKKYTVRAIKSSLSQFESINLITLLKRAGIDNKLPMNLTMDKLAKSGVSVNGDVNKNGIKFVIQLPDSIQLSSNLK